MTYSYAVDGKCHNAEPGTYGHECGKPAVWVGESRQGFRSGFCADCRRNGYESKDKVLWQPFNQSHELAVAINRSHRDDRGIIDEVAMRALFDAHEIALSERVAIWRALTA